MNRPSSPFFHGWVVVAAAFTVLMLGFGSAYTFGSFVEALQTEFGATRGSVSLVFSIAGFLYFALGAVSGPLADRWGASRLVAAGIALVGLGMMAASIAPNLATVYLAYGIGIGIGVGVGCAYVPAVGAVQRWFVKKRGLASGMAVSGIGIGTLAMPPLATWLILQVGWRDAYLVLGVLAAVAGIAVSFLLDGDPRQRGCGPDGEPWTAASGATMQRGVGVAQAIRSPRFVGLYLAGLICAFGVFVPFVHLVPYAIDHGITPTRAVLLLG